MIAIILVLGNHLKHFAFKTGYINKDLPNSWECPKCVKSGNTSKANSSNQGANNHGHHSQQSKSTPSTGHSSPHGTKASKSINWSMMTGGNGNSNQALKSQNTGSAPASSSSKRLRSDETPPPSSDDDLQHRSSKKRKPSSSSIDHKGSSGSNTVERSGPSTYQPNISASQYPNFYHQPNHVPPIGQQPLLYGNHINSNGTARYPGTYNSQQQGHSSWQTPPGYSGYSAQQPYPINQYPLPPLPLQSSYAPPPHDHQSVRQPYSMPPTNQLPQQQIPLQPIRHLVDRKSVV